MAQTETINDAIDKIIATVGELPAAPAMVSVAMGLTSDLQSDIKDIARVLSADQSMTAKVLQLSNSSFYGRPKEVKTLQEAIVVLGFNAVRSIVIVTSSHAMYGEGDCDGPQTKLWRHTLSTAIAARQIAGHIDHPDKEEIFVAALLHDIGKLVFLLKLPEWYRKIIKEVEEKTCSFSSIESRVFRFDHSDLASVLLAKWSFPNSLICAISEHHRPPAIQEGGVVPTAHVISLANQMAKKLGVGFKDERIDVLADVESAQAMALDEKALDQIFTEFQSHYLVESRAFEESSA